MPVASGVRPLNPADLAVQPSLWEPGLAPDEAAVVVIEGTTEEWDAVPARAASELHAAPVVTVGVVRGELSLSPVLHSCDVIVEPGERERVLATLHEAGPPALLAAQVLRAGDIGSVAIESLAYSTLLAGAPFAAWRATRAPRAIEDLGEPRVTVVQRDGVWRVTLTRPDRHNAFDGQMREELCDALDAITSEPPAPIVLLGAGPSFCAGGDLDEFGTAAGPLTAHLVRCTRSVARRLDRVSDRLVVGLHGCSIGAGIELAAFARTVVAAESARFALPELRFGLSLGAGGTVSLPRRIGRHATLRLLLDREPIGADDAFVLGLVDEVVSDEALERHCVAIAEAL